jgi:hypothetical protein
MLLVPLILVVPGCGGCLEQDDPVTAAKKKKEKEDLEKKKKSEKPKDPFESTQFFIMEPGEGKPTSSIAKPGHWITASRPIKSNDADIQGEFYSTTVNAADQPMELEHSPFRLIMTRSASLPKGQTKHFEFLYYIPQRYEGQSTNRRLKAQLFARGGGRELYSPPQDPITPMPLFQYHMMVLAAEPDRYAYLRTLETVAPKVDQFNDRLADPYYRVSLPKLDKRVPLPHHPLAWTSTAYIFWDGIDPNLLAPQQQEDLLDWLHWGGQIVISGPDSLDTLRGSFLGELLPAEKGESIELEQSAFDKLNEGWALFDKKLMKKRTFDVVAGKPPVGVTLKLKEDAQWVPLCGELVAERRVGRGRIVVTAFSLTSRTFVNWGSVDNFVNGALLRRPHREFKFPLEGGTVPEPDYLDYSGRRTDPRLVTNLRYFTRDIGQLTVAGAPQPVAPPPIQPNPPQIDFRTGRPYVEPPLIEPVVHTEKDDYRLDGYSYDAVQFGPGIAGWNDFSGAANAARDSLRQAAGISIPKASFVLRVVAIYLLILVPVNWTFFRVIGRVEWAWIAAPIIAVVGGIAVVRLAQLDIGFVRAQSEIAVLEMHNGHPRAHATRYTALYASLSTTYDIHFADGNALAQPFAKKARNLQEQQQTPSTCYLHRDQGISLTGFLVGSASTEFLHSEQMVPMSGSLKLKGNEEQGWEVENTTSFTIRDAAVLRCFDKRKDDKTVERFYMAAYLGELAPKVTMKLQWQEVDASMRMLAWKDSPVMTAPPQGSTEVSLHGLVDLATRQLRLNPGELRLIGWMDTELPGMEVSPKASQKTARTLVLAHLREAPLPMLVSDVNMRKTVVDDEEEDKEKEDSLGEKPPPAEGT